MPKLAIDKIPEVKKQFLEKPNPTIQNENQNILNTDSQKAQKQPVQQPRFRLSQIESINTIFLTSSIRHQMKKKGEPENEDYIEFNIEK